MLGSPSAPSGGMHYADSDCFPAWAASVCRDVIEDMDTSACVDLSGALHPRPSSACSAVASDDDIDLFCYEQFTDPDNRTPDEQTAAAEVLAAVADDYFPWKVPKHPPAKIRSRVVNVRGGAYDLAHHVTLGPRRFTIHTFTRPSTWLNVPPPQLDVI